MRNATAPATIMAINSALYALRTTDEMQDLLDKKERLKPCHEGGTVMQGVHVADTPRTFHIPDKGGVD